MGLPRACHYSTQKMLKHKSSVKKSALTEKNGKTNYPEPEELISKLKRVRDDDAEPPVKKTKHTAELLYPELTWPTLYSPDGQDGQYSPLSPCYSADEDEDDDDDASQQEREVAFEDAFFRDCPVPFVLDRSKDAFLLDPVVSENLFQVRRYADRNEDRHLFGRDIRSYKNGTTISKHCAPWGEVSLLCNEMFTVEKKIFRANGQVAFVMIRDNAPPHREYAIEPPFFQSWTDRAGMQAYLDYSL